MNFARSHFRPLFFSAFAAALLLPPARALAQPATPPSTASALAADSSPLVPRSVAPAAPVPAQDREVSRVVVRHARRTATYIQIAPLPPPATARRPAPAAVPPLPDAAELAREAQLSAKRHGSLLLSATIHPGPAPLTELTWSEDGTLWRAISNLDFRLLQPLSAIETAETFHDLFFLPGLAGPEEAPPLRPSDLPLTPAGYRLLPADDHAWRGPSADTLTALDALHRHHDAHRPALLAALAERQVAEALAEAAEARARLLPPAPLVVRYAPPAAAIVAPSSPAPRPERR